MGMGIDCRWPFSLHMHSSNHSYIFEDPVINVFEIGLRQREHGFSDKLGRQSNVYFPKAAQHSVHLTGGSRCVFRQFTWLEAGSVKVAFSRPAHQRVTPAV